MSLHFQVTWVWRLQSPSRARPHPSFQGGWGGRGDGGHLCLPLPWLLQLSNEFVLGTSNPKLNS